MQQVKRIGEHKKSNRFEIRDSQREGEVLAHWRQLASQHGLNSEQVDKILAEVLQYSRSVQSEVIAKDQSADHVEEPAEAIVEAPIAYPGIPYCYSHLAASEFVGNDPSAVHGYEDFTSTLAAVSSGECESALLPVVNSIVGRIRESYQLMQKHALFIIAEKYFPIEHCLAVFPGTKIERIEEIASHPVALQQCQKLIGSRDNWVALPFVDTAAAAAMVANKECNKIAAICSRKAAEHHQLEIIDNKIADEPQNITRFLCLSRELQSPQHENAKSTLLLKPLPKQDALAALLRTLEQHSYQVEHLESWPVPDHPWSYQFFVDIIGDGCQLAIFSLMERLQADCQELHYLGSYPQGKKR